MVAVLDVWAESLQKSIYGYKFFDLWKTAAVNDRFIWITRNKANKCMQNNGMSDRKLLTEKDSESVCDQSQAVGVEIRSFIPPMSNPNRKSKYLHSPPDRIKHSTKCQTRAQVLIYN